MKKGNFITSIGFIVFFVIVVSSLSIILYVKKDLTIVTNKNSYSEEYAKKENIDVKVLSDNEKINDVNIEYFSYNYVNGGIEITDYNGISETLTIPYSINNSSVVSIAKDALKKDTNLKKIVISYNLKELNEDDFKDIEIECYDYDYCRSLKENENLNVKILYDSDYRDFNYKRLEYDYNYVNNKIEITGYNGFAKNIIIPTTINGYEVNKINMTLHNVDSMYLPNTVNDIKLKFTNNPYDMIFYFCLISDTIALIIVLIFNNLVKNKTNEDYFNNVPLKLWSVSYISFIFIYTFLTKLNNYDFKNSLIVILIITFIYIIISLSLVFSKKQIKDYDKKIKNIDDFIKNSLLSLDDIKEENEIISEIKDILKYSDPVSNVQTKEIEKEILDLISNGQKEDLEYWNNVKKLILKRNNICKNSK